MFGAGHKKRCPPKRDSAGYSDPCAPIQLISHTVNEWDAYVRGLQTFARACRFAETLGVMPGIVGDNACVVFTIMNLGDVGHFFGDESGIVGDNACVVSTIMNLRDVGHFLGR